MTDWCEVPLEYKGYLILATTAEHFYPIIVAACACKEDAIHIACRYRDSKHLKVTVIAAEVIKNWEQDYEGMVED